MPKKENLSKIVVKNTTYNFISMAIAKIGGLILTIFILARLLGPELFGIYHLAFSVIAILLIFTDLGIGSTATRYISEALGKNQKAKARTYFKYLLKLKIIFAISVAIILLLIAKPIAIGFYQEPLLLYPLLFAFFYVFISSIAGFPQTLLLASKDLRKIPSIQIIEVSGKIIFSLIAILIFSYKFEVPGVFLALGLSSLCVLIYSIFIVLKKDKTLIIGKRTEIEKPRILKYAGFMAVASLSLVIFASVDTLMLGKFVEAAYIGYYRAALGLVLSIGAIISIRPLLIPVFTQINQKRLQRGVNKVAKYSLMLSIPAAVGLALIAKNFIQILYGKEYVLSAIPLYALSFLIIVASLISIYRPIFQAKEKPKTLAKYISIALVINIILNYILIKSLLTYGQEYAILGAGLATLFSRTFLLTALSRKGKSEFKIKISPNHYLKPILAALIMALFIIIFNNLINMNLILGIIQVLVAIIIYFAVMLLIKGITKQDIKLLRFIPRPNFSKD